MDILKTSFVIVPEDYQKTKEMFSKENHNEPRMQLINRIFSHSYHK